MKLDWLQLIYFFLIDCLQTEDIPGGLVFTTFVFANADSCDNGGVSKEDVIAWTKD